MVPKTQQRSAAPQTRRPGVEIRRLILVAARELFASDGFTHTTTREIARRAEVAEQSVFSHFGSKQGVYEAAVLEPFEQFVRQFTLDWTDAVTEIESLEEMMARYVEGLYTVVRDQHELFSALPPDHVRHVATREVFDQVERWVQPLVTTHGYAFDPAMAVRMVFIVVTNTAMMEDDLLPHLSRAEIIDNLTATLLHGLTRKA
jgi:AcrR family transcriptional regulator